MSVKIFISCVSDEFRAYRDQLRTDLTRHNVEVKVQEDFKDPGWATVANDDVYIQACDAVIHLAGDMTGFLATKASTAAILAKYPDITEKLPLRELLEQGEDISYTHWEAWLAIYHGKPLMIAQAAEGAPRGPRFAPTDASRAAQRTHLDRLRAIDHYPGCSFASADQLVAHVLGSPVLDLLAKERSDAAARGAGWLSYIGLAIGMLVLLVTPWVADEWAKTLGIPVAAPLALVLAVGGFALPLIYSRYFIMLGAGGAPAGSRNRVGYDALRENLGTGGPATHFYARWLTAFLDRVDRFFGDAGMADRTLFSHAFGLKMPAPLWTAPAFERCLLLALFYPIATILIMWVASGHVGPAEKVLGLPDVASWARGGAVALLGLSAIAFWRAARASRLTSFAWLASAFALAGGFANTGAYLDATTWAFAFTFAGAIAGTFFVPFAYAGAIAGIIAGAGAFAITFASVAPYLCRNHP